MSLITSETELAALYGSPVRAALDKVADHLTPLYLQWITRSRFCILSTVGPQGTDASPRGDDGPVVRVQNPKTLLMPDWRGNNRLDSLRNIVCDGRVSLMFMVPGNDNVIRVNGRAEVDTDPELLESFTREGQTPRSVIRVHIGEVYFQCARALKRSDLWSRDDSEGLPSAGEMIRANAADFDADTYDRDWPARAAKTMW